MHIHTHTHTHTHTNTEMAMSGHSKKEVTCKPGKEASPEPNPAGTLILGF